MAAKIYENITTVHHGLVHNEQKNIISVSKITILESGNSVMMFSKVIATIIIKRWPPEGKI